MGHFRLTSTIFWLWGLKWARIRHLLLAIFHTFQNPFMDALTNSSMVSLQFSVRKWNCKLTFLRQAVCGRQGGSAGTPKLGQNHQSIKTSSTRRVPQNTQNHQNATLQFNIIVESLFLSQSQNTGMKILPSTNKARYENTCYQLHTDPNSPHMIWWGEKNWNKSLMKIWMFDGTGDLTSRRQREAEQESDRLSSFFRIWAEPTLKTNNIFVFTHFCQYFEIHTLLPKS